MNSTRKIWLDNIYKIVLPVINAASEGKLIEQMPIEENAGANRSNYSPLEALGRTVLGIAPWLECDDLSGDEEKMRAELAEKTRLAIKLCTAKNSLSRLNFSVGEQPLVDAAFLAQGILRAPRELFCKLDMDTKDELIIAMKETRKIRPFYSNWLLFSATIEALIHFADKKEYDSTRIDYALKKFEDWYVGDGCYSDGNEYHFDYYNSFVISPMLYDVLCEVGIEYSDWSEMQARTSKRLARYAQILEKMIAPDGSYPVVGRSMAYRFGAFAALSYAACKDILPNGLSAAATRCALTSVIKKVMSYNNFDSNGWLKIGIAGSQLGIAENYISTGSLYLATTIFTPLGLSPSSGFWSDADELFSSEKIWSEKSSILADHSL